MISLWDELTAASWVANTGIPLLLTLAAILAGFWTMRRQMHNDRHLLTAQNRAQAARALGSAILRETAEVSVAPVPGSDPSTWRREYFDQIGIGRSVADGGNVLGELPNWEVVSGKIDRSAAVVGHVWRFGASRRRSAVKAWGFDNQSDMDNVMSIFMFPYIKHLNDTAAVLMRWDGVGPIPDEPSWSTDMPVSDVYTTSRHTPNGFWTGQYSWAFSNGEPRELDPEWYAELDASWQSCLECWHDIVHISEADIAAVQLPTTRQIAVGHAAE